MKIKDVILAERDENIGYIEYCLFFLFKAKVYKKVMMSHWSSVIF